MCKREGRPLPERIQNAPELWPGLDFYYLAWRDLDTTRATGWGVGPISWLSILTWAEAHEVSGDEFKDLVHHIRALDNAYLEWREAQTPESPQVNAHGGE